jgi:hypothetical protein
MPETTALVQPNVIGDILLVGVYTKAVLLQTAAGVNVLLNVGVGFTVTATLNGTPTQLPAAPDVGVTV